MVYKGHGAGLNNSSPLSHVPTQFAHIRQALDEISIAIHTTIQSPVHLSTSQGPSIPSVSPASLNDISYAKAVVEYEISYREKLRTFIETEFRLLH
jgi:hypothetical protein